jgi:hypothetical protein
VLDASWIGPREAPRKRRSHTRGFTDQLRDNRLVDELARLVDALADDPVFAMSLGSRELFHSNLLAWFLDRFPIVRERVAAAWKLADGPPTSDGKL